MFRTPIGRSGIYAGGMLLAATLAFAQTPPPPSPTAPPTPASPVNPVTPPQAPASSMQTTPVTITGCVQRADGAVSSGLGFVLKNGVVANSAAATTGTATTPAAVGVDYSLVTIASTVQLADHIGHQVEVKGALMPGGLGSNSAQAGNSAQSGNTTASTTAAGTQTLTVTSVRMLSSTCATR